VPVSVFSVGKMRNGPEWKVRNVTAECGKLPCRLLDAFSGVGVVVGL